MRNLICLLLLSSFVVKAQDYKISPWFEQKKSAVVLTFDDALPEHFNTVIPLMDSYDFEGTFYINKLNSYNWTGAAISEGHEIGNHTQSHPNLLDLTASELKVQVSAFRDTLIHKTGYEVSTIAYPFGAGSETAASSYEVQDTVANFHIAGRGVYSFGVSDWVYDFATDDRGYYQLPSLTGAASNWFSSIDNCIDNGGFLPLFYHAIGNPAGFDNVSEEEFTSQLNYLQAKGDSVWVTTLANSIKYHRERKTAELVELSAPFVIADNWRLSLTDEEHNHVYNQPLSIELTIPLGITAIVGAAQNGVEIPYKILNDTVYFNAVPDGGDIDLTVLDCIQPFGDLTQVGTDTFCLPNEVIYEFDYDPNYEYTWFKDGLEFATDTNKISVKETGEFYAKVQLEGCPLNTAVKNVNVTGTCGVPHPDFTVNKTTQFKDEVVVFNSTSTNLERTEDYYWDFGFGASKLPGYYGAGPIEVVYTEAGKKDVLLTVEGSLMDSSKQVIEMIQIDDFTACHAFKTEFDSDLNPAFLGGWHDYTITTENNAMRITTKDNGGNEWYIVKYAFNDGLDKQVLDFSDPLFDPVLHFRLKASDSCRVAVHLIDENGTFTAGMAINSLGVFDLTTQYQEFEVDFNELFYHQWDNKDVDSTKIIEVGFTINSGFKSFPFTTKFGEYVNENFVGNVDIDWISVGGDCTPDSLFGNIVIPHEVKINEPFTVWNYSNPGLVGAIYEWDFGADADEEVLMRYDEAKLSNSFSTSGMKTVKLKITKADGEVINVEEKIKVLDPTSIKGNSFEDAFFVNPFGDNLKGELNVKYDETVELILMDIQGRVVFNATKQFSIGKNLVQIPTGPLKQGVYLLTMKGEHGHSVVKLKH